jgi:thiosulfate/3-mercaptopyruvate sulfurtransferase
VLTTIVETGELAGHADNHSWRLVDCRFDLRNPAAGELAYEAGHIPGAVYAHLDRDLSGPKTGSNGRHPLPDSTILAQTLGRLGIGPATQVVAYDQDSGQFASRLWWMLRWLGHDAAAVLNGGFAKWVSERRPTRPGIEIAAPQTFTAEPRAEMLASLADVADASRQGVWSLVDARAPERYRGEIEPLDRVAGHIPGARNHFFQTNLTDRGVLRSRSELEARFRETLGETQTARVICYCGSGVTACQNLLALEHAGLRGGRLYAGSWSEWSSDPSRPVATGDDPS